MSSQQRKGLPPGTMGTDGCYNLVSPSKTRALVVCPRSPSRTWGRLQGTDPSSPKRRGETRAARLLPILVTGARAPPQAQRPGNPSPLLINGKNVPRLSDGQRLIPSLPLQKLNRNEEPPSLPPPAPASSPPLSPPPPLLPEPAQGLF